MDTAISASLMTEGSKMVWVVDGSKDMELKTVSVDANTGAVLGVTTNEDITIPDVPNPIP